MSRIHDMFQAFVRHPLRNVECGIEGLHNRRDWFQELKFEEPEDVEVSTGSSLGEALLQLHVNGLELQLDELRDQVSQLELQLQSVSGGAQHLDPFRFAEADDRVRQFTRAIFPGSLSSRTVVDPEFGDKRFVLTVNAPGTVDQLLALNDRWHRELHLAAGEFACHYVLCLIPSDESE